MRKNKKVKPLVVSTICAALMSVPLVVNPIASAVVYEAIFSSRYQPDDYSTLAYSDFSGLCVDRSDFLTDNGAKLAGYKYYKENVGVRGLVVLAHGLGCGGHNMFIPFIDYFTSNGYYVFTYDATGNGESEGGSIEGLPQGVIDLDYALNHVSKIREYKGLPVVLFGHSWGAYSCGNVLNFHPEIKAAIIISGCNESGDFILSKSKEKVGNIAKLFTPAVSTYEKIKFGTKYTSISAIDGMKNSNAKIMIVHSRDDSQVPTEYGYDKFYSEFKNNDRFEFVLYENRGHNYLFFSEESAKYRDMINKEYKEYVESSGKEYSAEIKSEFMSAHLDKKRAFEPDYDLMEKILKMYDSVC